ncbi:hypothetical protein BCON_0181g00150 [Botryotinia convoluta]|uniref:Heterokaryon incompatibility domain-containing protein n=1 Tax=Botryotinia convoluta TaxID=54673 RepID=A0A4Z1HND0_9HELO|nr:hypothetical protein BCON_0181g00150 [Botryotinia convoluta]
MYVSADGGCVLCALILKSFEEKGARREDSYNIIRFAAQPSMVDVGSMWESDGDRIEKVSPLRLYELTWESDRNRIEKPASRALHNFMRESDAERKIEFSLGIYTSEDDPLARCCIPSRPISTDVSSEGTFKIITTWLQECLLHHKQCHGWGKVAQKLPARVIDVQYTGRDPFLLETSEMYGSWIALSYCWGSSPTLKTTTQNLSRHRNMISISSLPQTMRDAVEFTRRIGYQYLWIDALCIIQDSTEDWAIESLKMASVYGNATLTIAAEAAVDTSSGIFDSTNVFRQKQHINQCESFNFSIIGKCPYRAGKGTLYLRESLDFDRSSLAGYLSKRVWALQEDLLSPRLIRFGKAQLYWRCKNQESMELCPTRALQFDRRYLSRHNHSDFVYQTMNQNGTKLSSWYGIVNDYTTRDISVPKDVLVGISAIARFMSEAMGQAPTTYKAGLWEYDFCQGLTWRRSHASSLPLIRHAEYIAPFWSWASISASHMQSRRIYNNISSDEGSTFYSDATIIWIVIETENNDPFGIVKGGFVTLEGLSLEICLHEIPSLFLDCPKDVVNVEINAENPLFDEDLLKRNLIAGGCTGAHSKVLLFIVSSSSRWAINSSLDIGASRDNRNTLILESTQNSGEYQRVGCFTWAVRHGNLQHQDWTFRRITII